MGKFRTLRKLLASPGKFVMAMGHYNVFNWLPDSLYLKLVYKGETGLKLDLKNPKTFSEKLQWLKLNDRKEIYKTYVDKYAVRKYISETIGEQYLIPLLGVYDSVDEIPFEELPDRFVLKCTHGSSSNIICTDKSKLNIENAKAELSRWMKKIGFGLAENGHTNMLYLVLCAKPLLQMMIYHQMILRLCASMENLS